MKKTGALKRGIKTENGAGKSIITRLGDISGSIA